MPRAKGDVDHALVERALGPARLMHKYCRVEVEGLENVPAGAAVLAANHTGWTGLDFSNLFVTLHDGLGRVLRTAVHPTFFRTPGVRDLARRLGFFEVSVAKSASVLDAGGLVLFFPEAEAGNFKPIWRRYKLETFKPGFARVALASQAPIVPVVIVGGEEANPSLHRFDGWREKLGISLPLPVNVFPFPVKWRIRFMPPVSPDTYLKAEASVDSDVAETISRDVSVLMQKELMEQVRKRGSPWL